MKAFSVFLNDVNDGRTHAELTRDLQELFAAVQANGRAGALTIKLKVSPAVKGRAEVDKVTVSIDRKLELPKPDAPADFFWLTDEAEPTRQHPRQHELPLRNVQAVDGDGVVTFKEVTG